MLDEIIISHLKSRPIRHIYEISGERSEVSLKIMCIVDYLLTKKQLYSRISAIPKLLPQLLRFRSFENFHFFEIKLNNSLRTCLLRCACCELIASYKNTLEHMMLNHGRAVSVEMCQWCGVTKIRKHIEQSTTRQCYQHYLQQNRIDESVFQCASAVIKTVYEQIRLMASKLGVKTKRRDNYQARQKTQQLFIKPADASMDCDDISNEVFVSQTPYRAYNQIKLDQLDALFYQAMKYFGVAVPMANEHQQPYAPSSLNDDADASTSFEAFENNTHSPEFNRQMHEIPQISPTTSLLQQQQQQREQQQPTAFLPWMPSTSPEIMNVTSYLTSALQNMRNESIRQEALIALQQCILNYVAKDLQSQIEK